MMIINTRQIVLAKEDDGEIIWRNFKNDVCIKYGVK